MTLRSDNRFKGLTPQEAVFQAIGAGSTCWENMSGTGVFQSDEAKSIGDDLLEYIEEYVKYRQMGF